MRSQRFALVSDTHGDMIDPIAEAAFFDFIKDFKPQIRIHAGDLWDMRNLRKGASDDERTESMREDWDMGCDFFHRYFTDGKINYFLRGNHERVWRIDSSSNGLLRDYCESGIREAEAMCRRRKVHMLPYDSRLGVLRLGKITVIHGYHAGLGAANHHARIYHSCFFGHTHTQDVAPVPNCDGPAEARGIGCLCQIDMPYNQHQTNKLRHQQGWIYGELYEDGTYTAFQTKRVGNSFAVATGIKHYGK